LKMLDSELKMPWDLKCKIDKINWK
jgi:hypothetical protein